MPDLSFSRIAMGCEAIGGTDWGVVDDRQAHEAVRCALDCGITVFDTADVYGLGRGEEMLSLALGPDRHRVTIVTKGGLRWTHPSGGTRATTRPDARGAYLRLAIGNSLKRLRIEVIPLYLVHWPDPDTPLTETFECLEQARADGLVGAYGLSNFPIAAVQQAAEGWCLSAIEGPLSLISSDLLFSDYEFARQLGLATLTYAPLAQGLLTGKYSALSTFSAEDRRHRLEHFSADAHTIYQPVLDALKEVARELERPIAQVAIRWVIDTGISSSVVVGAKSPTQMLENCSAQSWSLSHDHIEKLARARRLAGLASL